MMFRSIGRLNLKIKQRNSLIEIDTDKYLPGEYQWNSTLKRQKTPLNKVSQKRKDESIDTHLKHLREAVFKRDRHRCVICGSKVNLNMSHLLEKLSKTGEEPQYFIMDLIDTTCGHCHPFRWHSGMIKDEEWKAEQRINLNHQARIDLVEKGYYTYIGRKGEQIVYKNGVRKE